MANPTSVGEISRNAHLKLKAISLLFFHAKQDLSESVAGFDGPPFLEGMSALLDDISDVATIYCCTPARVQDFDTDKYDEYEDQPPVPIKPGAVKAGAR